MMDDQHSTSTGSTQEVRLRAALAAIPMFAMVALTTGLRSALAVGAVGLTGGLILLAIRNRHPPRTFLFTTIEVLTLIMAAVIAYPLRD